MSDREEDQKAVAREMSAQQAAHVNTEVSRSPAPGDTMCTIENNREDVLESTPEGGFLEPANISLPEVNRVDAAELIRTLQQLEVVANRPAPRIAVKANGRILFLDLREIMAVEAEGNYVSLQHRPSPYLLRECLSSMADKLRPYGFIRIHRSVIVNIAAVAEIQPLPTGEYRLRLRGGKEYLVTRTYKDNLKDLAQLWLGSGRVPGEPAEEHHR